MYTYNPTHIIHTHNYVHVHAYLYIATHTICVHVHVRAYMCERTSTQHTSVTLYFYLDNNECATDNGNCDDVCVNSLGNFHCACQEGFSLTSNGISCEGEPTLKQ